MFRLSKRVDFGLLLLERLAHSSAASPLSVSEIAEGYRLSANFLAQIANQLKTAGLLNSREGSGGGYWLAKKVDEIKLFEVFSALGENRPPVRCLAGHDCPALPTCRVRSVWKLINQEFETILGQKTLADFGVNDG